MSQPIALPDEPLEEWQQAILDFEQDASRLGQAQREQEVRDRFDMSLPRYTQVLNQLLDHPAALAHQPLLVRRLRRLREQRRLARSAAPLVR
ncbi:DUF3263 domain-containing protein [Luteococcus sp.]|uniref:DUF3263 domain-containing protein n=1 Tax=Luteococcus sp. TaxID=1969402 RepID=UPI00373660A6